MKCCFPAAPPWPNPSGRTSSSFVQDSDFGAHSDARPGAWEQAFAVWVAVPVVRGVEAEVGPAPEAVAPGP